MGFNAKRNKDGTITVVRVEDGKEELTKGDFTAVRNDDGTVRVTRTGNAEDELKWYQGYLQAGALGDGITIGNVVKTILGTKDDIEENVTSAVFDATEALIDTGADVVGLVGGLFNKDFQDKTSKFIARDLQEDVVDWVTGDPDQNKRIGEVVNEGLNWTSPLGIVENLYVPDSESASILGEKGDSLVQSGVQMAGARALKLIPGAGVVLAPLARGVTAYGNEIEQAYQQNATPIEARVSGVVSAGAEILFEQIGGMSLFKSTPIDDMITKRLATKVSNKVVRTLIKLGVDVTTEGFEEVATDFTSRVGQKLTYMDEKSWKEMLASEEAFNSYLDNFISGGIMGGVFGGVKLGKSIKTHTDYTTGLTANEEQVVKKVYENRVAEAEKEGKVTEKQKNKIYDEVVEEMNDGELSLETIEELFGGETYEKYKSTLEQEQADIDELSEMYEGEELQQEIDKYLKASKHNELSKQLSNEVYDKIKDSRLAESYHEYARGYQKFEADLSQYDDKQSETIRKAIESGILNNTRRTHKFVDWIAKLSADKGVSFDFTNNEKIAESGFAVEGKTVNGYVDENGKVVLNVNSSKALKKVTGHEVTHILEGTELYKELQKTVVNYAMTKKATDSNFENEYQERLRNAIKLYKNVKGYQGTDGFNKIRREVVADLVGDYIFTDEAFVQKLSTENRNLFQKIYDEIKYLCKLATAGSKEARELEKVKKAFEDAYRADGTKFTLTQPVEETKTLMAFHNLTAEKLQIALERDGFIRPSVAITDKNVELFGDITAILKKQDIDPDVDKNNKLYGSDAWTPHENVLKKNAKFDTVKTNDAVEDIKNSIGQQYAQDVFNATPEQFMEAIVNADGSIFDAYAHDLGMQTAYAMENGVITEIPTLADGTLDKVALKDQLDSELGDDIEWGKYRKWLNKISDTIITSYDEASDTDILNNMNAQPETAKPFKLSETGELVVPSIEYASIEEMRQNKHRLSENAEAENKAVANEFLELADRIGSDKKSVVNAINTAFNSRYSTADIVRAFKKQGITINTATAKELQNLYKKAVELPTLYFEGKPGGKIDLNRVAVFAVPTDLDSNLKQALLDRGFEVVEYDRNKEGDRYRVVNSYEDLKFSLSDSDGKPIEVERISRDESNVKYSISHNADIAKGQTDYIGLHKSFVSPEELAEAQKVTSAMVDVMMKYSEILPEDRIGKVLTKNGSYDRSVENTTICVRTLAYNEFVDKVQEEIGRPLTQMESFLVSQKLYDIASDPQCLYCYVSLDRKAFNDMLLRYMQDRDSVIAKYNNSDKTPEAISKLYEDFLHGRKDTKNMKDRFNKWIGYADNGTQLLSLADIATEDRQSVIKANGGILASQLADARAYAQSASWSKIQKNYVAYRDEILKLNDKVVKNLNEHYGLRWYSFSDYSPAFIVENMQQITDASIRGLKGLSYTKDTDFAEIFAPTGMNVNISVFVNQDANGNFFIDEKQSANLEKALDLRKRYSNVGIVATVTNDEALRWAGEQDWTDVIIPFHIVRTGADVAEYYKWLNYTAESADSVSDGDLWNAYLDSLNLSSENARKKVSKNIYPSEHNNDKSTYLNLCESRGLVPRFARFAGEDWYMKLVNETRLSAGESSTLKPSYNLEAAKESFQKFIEKGGYEGGWYKETVDVDAEAKAVAQDVLAGKKANEVPYGRQDGFNPENLITSRRANRKHGQLSLSELDEHPIKRGKYDVYGEDIALKTAQNDIAPVQEQTTEAAENLSPDSVAPTEALNETTDTEDSTTNNLKEEYARIDNRIVEDKANVTKEFEQKKKQLQSEIADKGAFVSTRAFDLYKEISRLKKGVRASQELGYILDRGYEWQSVKNALISVKNSPNKTVNPNSAVESVIRELINEEYESKAFELDELDNEYQEEINKLEAKAEQDRSEARKAEERITRSELHKNIVDEIKTKFTKHGFDFDETLKKAKNLSTFATVDNTPQRVMEKALGYKAGQILADETVNKVAQNETEGIKWLNSFTDRKNGLLAQISKQYNIKPGSKESAAAQMYAEGFYVDKNNDIIKYGDDELAKDFPDAKVRENIKGLAKDQRIRQIYDETLSMINESRTRNAYPEIPRLDNYFLHFRAMEDTFSKLGLPFNPNDIRAKDLPTDLNGVTADLKPGQPYFASAMHRTGKRTSFDLLGGLEKYLSSAKNQIYHIDDIQTLRALRNYVADTYGQANGLEGLDSLSDAEAEERIKQVYDSHLSTFAKFLNEEANVIAGKTALIDRGIEGIIGRRGITFIDNINKQVGSNMVGFNVSSSMTNFLAGVQAIAKSSKLACVKALAQTTSSKINSIFGKTDSFVENNPTIIRRSGAERFYRTPYQKVGDAGYVLMSAVDNITTEFIVRAKYNEFINKGMSEEQAITEADKWTSRLMGDRSLGQMPQLYNSKMLGLITKFQLEVRNQLDSQFYDTIQEAKVENEDIQNGLERNAKTAAKVTKTLFELAVLQHLFGTAFESVAGYNPAFDIIGVLATALGFDDDEESEDTALDNVAQGFRELLEDLPYASAFTGGGRIPISSALPYESDGIDGFVEDIEENNWKNIAKEGANSLVYAISPTGYGQVKKTVKGLSMFNTNEKHPVAGSYTDSGNLRFPVEDTFGNRVQAGLFGQYANENAREYFDNGYAPLKEKQIQEYKDVDIPIKDYWKYREGLAKLETNDEKVDYIDSLDLPLSKKNILVNNVLNREEDVSFENYAEFSNLVAKFVIGYDAYKSYSKDLNNIKADKDKNGNTISGSRKKKVFAYINGLDIDYGEKIILWKSEYKSDNTYNREIVEYLRNRKDLSYDDKATLLKELGFKVDDNGNAYWY